MGHLVVSAAQLEAEYGLLVFTLEEDIAFESVAEVDGVCEGSDLAGLVDSGCGAGDKTKVLRRSASQLVLVEGCIILTSGYPVGRRYSSGTISLMRARFSSDGVDGLALYSVKAIPVVGVCGRE